MREGMKELVEARTMQAGKDARLSSELRDRFIAAALTGLCTGETNPHTARIAMLAVLVADAAMKERSK